MFKRTAAAILIFSISLMPASLTFAKSYPDVSEDTAAFKAVDRLSEMGIIDGYEDGFFKPDGEITRGEAAALIARSTGYTDAYQTGALPFADVKSGYWAEKFISYCYKSGLINGMTENTYCPAEKVTYGQMVKLLVCASGLNDTASASGGKWYDGYIEVANEKGILENVSINPNSPAKRGDAAILLYNCFEKGLIGKQEEPEPTPEPTPTPEPEEETVDRLFPVEAPTPTPEYVKVNKEDVTYLAEVKAGYEFAKGLSYTPVLSEGDIDLSEIQGLYTDKSLLIVIDAGHNFSGIDVGAHNEAYDLWEQNITISVAQMLKAKLEAMGFQVVMTRDSYNTNVKGSTTKEALLNRAGIANGLEADLFISIHCNAGGGKGVETYCYQTGTKAELLAKAVQKEIVGGTALYDRGVKTAGFVVIKETVMPAILVETAFIDRAEDFEFLISRQGQNKLSTAIAKGVLSYANNED